MMEMEVKITLEDEQIQQVAEMATKKGLSVEEFCARRIVAPEKTEPTFVQNKDFT